jgi:hypothetical protein
MKPEERLQHDLVMKFSQKYPDQQERLFMVQNNTYSQAHGNRMKSMGLRKSISDLMFIGDGFFAGIELKADGQKHKRSHIINQLKWGVMMIELGHFYIMTSNIDDAELFLTALMENNKKLATEIQTIYLRRAQELLDNSGSVVFF